MMTIYLLLRKIENIRRKVTFYFCTRKLTNILENLG